MPDCLPGICAAKNKKPNMGIGDGVENEPFDTQVFSLKCSNDGEVLVGIVRNF